ncbi:MAG: hypothetical protein K9G34_08415, partial [Melioribacteraceae bacterium]|nr:hypothetical protein [Melioribacteraceae bacterium]
IGGFNYFNPEVKAEYTLNDDALDFMCMLAYMNDRMSAGAGLDSPHFIDLGDEECIPYLPNQALDHIVDW